MQPRQLPLPSARILSACQRTGSQYLAGPPVTWLRVWPWATRLSNEESQSGNRGRTCFWSMVGWGSKSEEAGSASSSAVELNRPAHEIGLRSDVAGGYKADALKYLAEGRRAFSAANSSAWSMGEGSDEGRRDESGS